VVVVVVIVVELEKAAEEKVLYWCW